ncbi:TipJ family phage tail tip protein [Mitsuokella jalaludinii]|uniref:TipJ family phage tail tip protein n=1 Tax=Mitsuokella jalaludinii TaxID=187979 RepID=UPI0020D156BD|nr:phage tail protein [Mitsuokella jalaludinii]MCQ1532801.1 phage tail protein [Mitsuokella jalaludinii]
MIQVITIKNPFENRKEIRELYWTGKELTAYVDTDGMDIFVDGHLVEQPDATIPPDGSQIICTPHIAGKGLKRILGFAAMIALTVYAGNVGGGLWAKAGSFFAKGAIGATLASGAVMLLGGKLINAIFPQDISTPKWNDQESSRSYGWDLPTPSTLAGNCVGETYGECIPAAQLLEQHVETINNKQYLNLLYCGGYGPVDSIDKIRIDYTDIGNFTGVQLETRLGTNDQKPISFFHTTPLDQSVGLELDVGAPLVRTSDSALASSLEVTLEWPAGLYHINDDSNFGNATTKFRIEYRKSGADTWTLDKEYTETAATNEALRKSYQINGLEEGRYDVRVTLLSKPSSSRDQAMVQWTLLTSYNNGVYTRPGKVLVAMRILATNQLSGGVPSVSWRQKRSTVWVYNPNESAYERQPANNPIWAAYDIMHQCRRLKNINTGEAEFVHYGCSHENLDAYYDQWKEAADYAFEMIVNEDGEKEHRYEFDAFFDTAQKRITAAQKAAAVGHAVIIAHGRNYGIVVDRPGHISQIFGEGRTTVSSVKGSFTSKEDRARAVDVTYNDEHNDFKNTMMTVRSPLYNKDTGVDNTTQLTLFGVKRRSQAYREAATALATSERQLQFVELQTDIDGIVAEYGDIVGYNHAVSRIGIASGRLASATASKVELDKSVDLDPAKTYEIYVTLSDDTIVKRNVASVTTAVKTAELTVTVPFDDAKMPARFDNYAFGECDKSIKPFRIVSASRDGDMLVSLKLAEYDEAMYATELDYSKYPVVDYSSSPSVAKITSLTAREQSRTIDRTAVPDVAVTWELSRTGIAPSSYIVQIESRNSSYKEQASTKMTAYTFRSVRAGDDYDITVYCIYDAVTTSYETTSLHVAGGAYSENNATNLIVMLAGKGFNLSWQAATGSAIAAYNVYQGAYGDKLEACKRISEKQKSVSCYAPVKDAGQYQFYVESIDKDGKRYGQVLPGIGSIAMPGRVTDAEAYTIYRRYQDGSTGYDIVVTFTPPSTPSAKDVEVYYKTNHIDMTKISGPLPEGVPADELGFYADWRYAGKGSSRVVIPAAQLGDVYKLKLVAEDVNGFTTPDSDATYLTLKVEEKQTVPSTPARFKKDFSKENGFVFSWDDVTDSDVDFYELRYDQNPGAEYNLIGRVQGTRLTVERLKARSATIYLYAHNATKKYSYPAKLSYDYPKLSAPAGVTIDKAILSVNLSIPDLAVGADGVIFCIEGRKIDIGKNTHYAYANAPGIYTVSACYYDVFGEGYLTAEYPAVIDPYIDPKYIEDESITLKMVDGTIKTAVSDAQAAIPRIEKIDGNIETIDGNIEKINGNITELKKTDGEILSTVAVNKKASDDADASLASQIKQTAESITSTVQSNKDAQDKKNKSLDDADASLASQIKQTASSITSTVQANKKASDDADASLASQIKQTAESITSTVQSNKKELSSQITQNADKITSVITNLSDKDKASAAYSAIAQMIDAIQLRVTADNLKEMGQNGQLMSYINLTPTTVSILSKLLHITAETLIDGNVITNGMIKSGAITADKLAASIIELTASQGIKGGGATLDTNGLTVRGSDGSYVVHGSSGMEFHDGNGNTFAMVGAMVMGTVKDGQWVKFTKPWKTVPNVIVTPISLQTAIAGYNSTNLYLDCRPQNVTVNGFQAVCRTVLKAGSGGIIPINKSANKDFSDLYRKGIPNLTSYTYDLAEIKVPDKATEVTLNSSWALENIGDIRWRSDDEDDYYDYYFGDIYVDMRIDVNGSALKTKRLGSSLGQKTNQAFHESKSGNDSEVITVKSGDTVKIYGVISVQTVKRGDFNPQYGDSYDGFGEGSASYTLTNYSFNTTADSPLASGNAFFLCTDKHNSPYTISDTQ